MTLGNNISETCCYFYSQSIDSNAMPQSEFSGLLGGREHPELVALRESMFRKVHENLLGVCHTCMKERRDTLYYQVNSTMDALMSSDKVDKITRNNTNEIHTIPTVLITSGMEIDENERMCQELKEYFTTQEQEPSSNHNQTDTKMLDNTTWNTKCVVVDTRYARTFRSQISAIIDQYMDTWYDSIDFDMIINHMEGSYTTTRNNIPRLLILFHYLEDTEPNLMDQLVSMVKEYIPRVNIGFVIWMTTPAWRLHEYLSLDSLSAMRLSIQNAYNSQGLIDSIVEKIFVKPSTSTCGFRLGGQVLEYLLDQFQWVHRSERTFITQLEYCLLEYYMHQPLSVLMPLFDDSLDNNLDPIIDAFLPFHFEKICICPSFQSTMEKQLEIRPGYVMKLLGITSGGSNADYKDTGTILDDQRQAFKSFLPLVSKEFMYYTTNFDTAFQCLYKLQLLNPTVSRRQTVLELYCECHRIPTKDQPAFINSEYFQYLMGLYRNLDEDKLYQLLVDALEIFKKSKQSLDLIEFRHNSLVLYNDLIVKLSTLLERYEKELANGPQDQGTSTFKAKRADQKEKTGDILRDIRSFFKEYFESNLKSYTELNCHEIFYFDSVKAVKHAFNTHIKTQVQDALMNPYHYLRCMCCDGQMKPTLPDISILYKLYLEFGRWIDLNDWLLAFITVLGIDPDSEEFEKNKDALRERFFQGVSELCHLGFVKLSSKRKDHALRLTFDAHVATDIL
jgi:origin recognition complex subunit 3